MPRCVSTVVTGFVVLAFGLPTLNGEPAQPGPIDFR